MLDESHIPFPLRPARVHEACGPAAASFAAIACALTQGPVLWVREGWRTEILDPWGIAEIFDPMRLMIAHSKDQIDTLSVAEEALRDGSIPLVVLEINLPLDLREGRRLQLAAKTGQSTGLCLIAEGTGSNAADTRWRCMPVFDPQGSLSTLMRWEIIRNKSGTNGVWNVRWNAAAHRLDVVSPVAHRPRSEDASG